jgi:hypothetical protein
MAAREVAPRIIQNSESKTNKQYNKYTTPAFGHPFFKKGNLNFNKSLKKAFS